MSNGESEDEMTTLSADVTSRWRAAAPSARLETYWLTGGRPDPPAGVPALGGAGVCVRWCLCGDARARRDYPVDASPSLVSTRRHPADVERPAVAVTS